MNASISVVCFKSKTLANGDHPLMIRICKDNKKVYKSIGISVSLIHWNFEKNEPKKNCPNRETINKIIETKKNEYRNQALEFKSINKNFTAHSLIEIVDKPMKNKTVDKFFEEQIYSLMMEKRIGNAKTYKSAFKSLKKFKTSLDIPFTDIDVLFLKQYETWLRSNNCVENTIGVYFRSIRAVFNKAIEDNVVKRDYYPFDNFKVSKFRQTDLTL